MCAGTDLFYVVNVSHSCVERHYVQLWGPNNCTYVYPTARAGRYPRPIVASRLGYYNSGDNIAVPCSVVDALTVQPDGFVLEINAGPAVPSNAESWDVLLAYAIAVPAKEPAPVYRIEQRTPLRCSAS